ncbi:hypothetical protein NQ315_002178 [Exocentrus adspersus]|uniref:Major facilitator superfamily (MFS) profile domain-containing protein n=1 Tax=Exocentrus adspersus TaxID=1586481 RepID=A0AAV8W106_9CUCU|nr:hypothetical protein NQ315_002178 [Exocentrus adspersus]
MFVSGTALTWSSPELPIISNATTSPFKRNLSDEEATWVSSLVTLGAAAGPFFFTYLADKMGRKYTLLTAGVPFVVCYLMMAFGRIVELFYVARFILGLTVGGVFSVLPIYAGEVADKNNRGFIGFQMGCGVCSGLLFSCALGPYISVMYFNLILAVFPLVFLILFPFVGKEVPHYYISINETVLAKEALQKLRGSRYDVEDELLEIQRRFKEEEEGSFSDLFRSRALIKAVLTSVGLLIFQQFSGINIVLFYGQTIFKEVGANLAPEVCTIIIVAMQFLSSFIAPLIGDKLGRKPILVFSAIGMALSNASLAIYSHLQSKGIVNMDSVTFLPLVIMVGFIVSYNTGYGPLPWAILGELFPSRVKTIATSSVTAVNWLLAFFITKHFEAMLHAFGLAEYFMFYAVCCVVAAFFAKFYLVETRGEEFARDPVGAEQITRRWCTRLVFLLYQ